MTVPGVGGQPCMFESPEQLRGLIEEYFESCHGVDGNGNKIQIRPITLEGLAYHIGCDRKTIWNYKHRPEYWPVIKRATDRCQVALIEHSLTARNPAGAIWLACNNYEYTQKAEINVTQTPEKLDTDAVKRHLMERGKIELLTNGV